MYSGRTGPGRVMRPICWSQLTGLMVEIVATRCSQFHDRKAFESLCDAAKVDVAHHHREAKKAADAKDAEKKARAKTKGKGKKGKLLAAAKKGARRAGVEVDDNDEVDDAAE